MQTKKRGGSIPNFTAELEHNLPMTHRGLKKNEISKVACKRSKRRQERYKTNERSIARASAIVSFASSEPSSPNALNDAISSEINTQPVTSVRQTSHPRQFQAMCNLKDSHDLPFLVKISTES